MHQYRKDACLQNGQRIGKSNSCSNSETLGWRLSDNGFFPLGRRVLGDNDQTEMELIYVLGGHILETHCNLSKQTVPALSLLWVGPGERRGTNSSKSADSHELGQRQWEKMQEVWAGPPDLPSEEQCRDRWWEFSGRWIMWNGQSVGNKSSRRPWISLWQPLIV